MNAPTTMTATPPIAKFGKLPKDATTLDQLMAEKTRRDALVIPPDDAAGGAGKVGATGEGGQAQLRPDDPALVQLETHALKSFQAAYFFKNRWMQWRIADCARRYYGEYNDDILTAIRAVRGCEKYVGATGMKVRAGYAQLMELMGDAMQPAPFPLMPAPVPDIDPAQVQDLTLQIGQAVAEVQQQLGEQLTPDALYDLAAGVRAELDRKRNERAALAARRHEKVLTTEWQQGRGQRAFNEFCKDFLIYPAAILRHELRKEVKEVWENGQPTLKQVATMMFRNVSPWDFYPSPQCGGMNDGFCVEWRRITRRELNKFRGVDGYSTARLDKVLAACPTSMSFYAPYQNVRLMFEGKDTLPVWGSADDRYDMLDYWGSVPGKWLKEWGHAGELEDETEYDVNVVLVGPYAIKATINPSLTGHWPFYTSSFDRVPDSIWGRALPEVIADPQDAINLTFRSMHNNVAMTSLPQTIINLNSLHPLSQATATQGVPFKMWLTESTPLGGGSPVNFVDIANNARTYLPVLDADMQLMDNLCGIPAYTQGDASSAGGAGRTAAGLRMLRADASRGIRQASATINTDVIIPLGQDMVYWNNQYHDDRANIAGDLRVNVEGISGALTRDDREAKCEGLLDKVLANPAYMQLVGPDAAKKLAVEVWRDADLEDLIPDAGPAPQGAGQQPQSPPGQAPAAPQSSSGEAQPFNPSDAGAPPAQSAMPAASPQSGAQPAMPSQY